MYPRHCRTVSFSSAFPHLAARERGTTAELIAHLAELDERKLHVAAGYTSTFVYCREVLRLSEQEAYNRIEVARAARRFPIALTFLAEGAVSLTALRLLAPHLTPDNHLALLQSARGLRTREVDQIVARLAPRPDVPTTIRKLPVATPPPAAPAPPAASAPTAPTDASDSASERRLQPAQRIAAPAAPPTVPASPTPAAPARAAVSSLSPDRYKLQVTITGELLEKLELAKDLLRHAHPSGDVATILDRALTALLVELAKKKFAATDRPRPASGTQADSRNVPAEVKRAVFVRDLGRCAFVGHTGRGCHERAFVEFHHVEPYAYGGPPTVENIELRCRSHNRLEWQRADVRMSEGPPRTGRGTALGTGMASRFETSSGERPRTG